MTTPPDSESAFTSEPTTKITQDIAETQGQVIAQMMGGLAVGQLTVYLSQTQTPPKTIETATDSVELGENPYQGLKAFREMDGDRFFGRDTQIQKLWSRFQELHGDRTTIRLLPIYGPSGSGKSSLARAGLIPALGKQPLPGKDRGRVVVLTPGTHPLDALATVLVRIATKDEIPVAKTREFKQELLQLNEKQQFDGLRRIADVLPDIAFSPLIVLVDQFEELYTLCDDDQVRHAFVENLLCAASDSSQRVSVIITMRSDFLGKTQQHPRLNQLFSSQGFLVPIMQPEELAIAITEPAKRAGYELDKATVQLLVEQSKGQEGALPLLQFALTQIWEGLRKGKKPADILEQIGGVGGALAKGAKHLYDSLTLEQQKIARSTFLALIQLNDNRKATRRRATISELITSEQDAPLVREVIERFARPGVWILVTFSNEQQVEMVEVAHEALIRNWQELQEWLNKHWENLRKKRKIEQFALDWQDNKKYNGYLLEGRILRDAREFLQAQKENTETSLSGLAKEFVKASIKKQRINAFKSASIFLVFPLIGTLIAVHLQIIGRANSILSRDDCKQDPGIKIMLQYMWWTRYANQLRDVKLCNEDLREVSLPGATMTKPVFTISNLSNANFHRAWLQESDFRGVTAAYTDFSNTFLVASDFRCLNDKCTELRGANFQNSKLQLAQFQNSFLKDADFKNADLTDANFDKAKYLTKEKLEGAILCRTKLPDYLNLLIDNKCVSN